VYKEPTAYDSYIENFERLNLVEEGDYSCSVGTDYMLAHSTFKEHPKIRQYKNIQELILERKLL
jgi:hypothetical protein